jgi:hypothetical protein
VSSAGYGLIHSEELIKPYSATFATEQADSVLEFGQDGTPPSETLSAWWDLLAKFQLSAGSERRSARTLTELLRREPDAWFLILAGPQYLRAMSDDIGAARNHLTDPDRLLIVSSSDAALPEDARSNWIPSKSPFQTHLGGSLASLHARVAKRILGESSDFPLKASSVSDRYRRHLVGIPNGTNKRRVPLSDVEVRDFIQSRLTHAPRLSYTALLRELRDGKQACEQQRFRRIYREVAERAPYAT